MALLLTPTEKTSFENRLKTIETFEISFKTTQNFHQKNKNYSQKKLSSSLKWVNVTKFLSFHSRFKEFFYWFSPNINHCLSLILLLRNRWLIFLLKCFCKRNKGERNFPGKTQLIFSYELFMFPPEIELFNFFPLKFVTQKSFDRAKLFLARQAKGCWRMFGKNFVSYSLCKVIVGIFNPMLCCLC